MDPIMRKWLQSLSGQPLKTELEWQNRANKPLSETVYGIVAKTLLNEHRGDPFADMSDKDFETYVRQNPGTEQAARRLRADAQDARAGLKMAQAQAQAQAQQKQPVDTKPATTQPLSAEQSGKLINKVGRGADTGALAAFGALGAADLPSSFERVKQSETDLSNTGTYGLSRLGGGYKFNPTKSDYEKMAPEELKAKSEALHTMDYGKLVGDAAITTTAAIEVPGRAGAGKVASALPERIKAISELPGVKQAMGAAERVLPTVSKVASTVFPAAVVFGKSGELRSQLIDNDKMGAAKTGLEGAYWAGELAAPGNKISTAGIGHELLHSGAKGLYGKAKEGNLGFDVGTGVDVLNTGLGAYMTQAPYIAAAKSAGKEATETAAKTAATTALQVAGKEALEVGAKEAGEVAAKTAGKAALKAVGKQIPGIGLAVAAPFAAWRAAKGDWTGAALELAGGLPVIGLGAQGYLAVRDYEKEMEKLSNKGAQEAQAQDIRDELKFKSQNKKTQQPVNSETSSDFETIKQKYKKVNPGAVSDIDKDKTTEIEDLLKRDSEGQVTGWGGASEEELMGPDFLKQKGKKQSIFESVMRKGLEIKGL